MALVNFSVRDVYFIATSAFVAFIIVMKVNPIGSVLCL